MSSPADRKLIYIAHPMRGNNDDESWDHNINIIHRICDNLAKKIIREDKNEDWDGDPTPYFFAVQLFLPQFINENSMSQDYFDTMRKTAIEFCLKFVEKVDEIWVYTPGGRISSGVKADIERASKHGVSIVFKDKYPWE